jgi:hypothetical protein
MGPQAAAGGEPHPVSGLGGGSRDRRWGCWFPTHWPCLGVGRKPLGIERAANPRVDNTAGWIPCDARFTGVISYNRTYVRRGLRGTEASVCCVDPTPSDNTRRRAQNFARYLAVGARPGAITGSTMWEGIAGVQ